MAEDWDLYAVVRSCKSSATASSMVSTAKTTSSEEEESNSNSNGNSTNMTLSCLASLTFEEENDPFSFPKLGEPRNNAFQELQQLFFKPSCFFPNPTNTTTTSHDTIPNSPNNPNLRGSSGQQQHDEDDDDDRRRRRREQQYKHLRPQNGIVGTAQLVSSQSGFGGNFHVDQRRQQQVQQQQQQRQQDQNNQLLLSQQVHQPGFHASDGTFVPTTLPLQMQLPPNLPTSQNPRSRKRKNQLKKQVCQVTAENLNSDLWAWRKYGQKPIKGSPYPRNYYRCSSSKGCAARKQVERSNVDPDLFIVTYTGEHTHPRPAHRNSLAGSTRAKTTTAPATATAAVNSCSSPQSGASLSPTTPISTPQIADEEAAAVAVKRDAEEEEENDKIGDGGEECLEEGEEEDIDDENILIPNNNIMGLSDEFFYGFQQLGYSPPGAAC